DPSDRMRSDQVETLFNREAGRVPFNDKRRYAFLSRSPSEFGISARKDRVEIGEARVRDERLHSVDKKVIAFGARGRADRPGIAARFGLSHRKGGDRESRANLRKKLALQFRRSGNR